MQINQKTEFSAFKKALEMGQEAIIKKVELSKITGRGGANFPVGLKWKLTHAEKADRIIVKVSDEGIGISPENLKHIMDPFFTTKRSSGGTGLGLSISYNIVKAHGGNLEFVSEVGKGTTAILSLPVHREVKE